MENKKRGLFNKYLIKRTDGNPIEKEEKYFVLRLDSLQKDKTHRRACLKALATYVEEIKDHLPLLAKDLKEKYLDGVIFDYDGDF